MKLNSHSSNYSPYLLVRSLILWLMVLLSVLIWGLVVHIAMLFCSTDRMHILDGMWARYLVWISRTKLIVEGSDRIFRDGPVIVLSNHQSLYDVAIFYKFLDIQFRWMAKASIFRLPVIGSAMRAAGYISVEREDRKKALRSLYDAAERIKNGVSVIIFPEGTRGHADGTMRNFKNGAFLLAKKAEVTLQPVTIWGANQIIKKEKGKLFQRIHPGIVRVRIHEPIPPADYADMKVDELSDLIRKTIEEPMEKWRGEHSLG